MPEQRQEENGDRLEGLDFLRDTLIGNKTQNYQTKINNLEEQVNWVRDEMRAQGDEVQHVLDQKINEILQMLQVSQFEGTKPQPTRATAPKAIEPPIESKPTPPSPSIPLSTEITRDITRQISQEHSQEQQIPAPEPAPKIVSPPAPPAEKPTLPMTDLDDFSQQINAILGGSSAPPPPPEPEPEAQPVYQAPPNPPVSPPRMPLDVPSPPVQQPQVIALEELQQRQNLRDLLADQEVMELRQANDELDEKLRQMDDCLATSPQPMHELLPLMTELVQLKVQSARAVEPPPAYAHSHDYSQNHAQNYSTVAPRKVSGKKPWKMIFAVVLLLLLIPLGFYGYWLWRVFVWERDVAIALNSTPELSLYRLNPDVKWKTLYLTGKLPSQSLSDRAAEIAQETVPTLAIENHILIVEALLDPTQKQTEIDKVLDPLNGINGIHVESQLTGDRLTLTGRVLRQSDIDVIIAAVEKISGISQVINQIRVEAHPISTQLYFDQNATAIKPDDLKKKLEFVKTFLIEHPDLSLRITGYQHPSESAPNVALKRAQITQILLQDQGIDRRRIVTLGVSQSPPDITPSEPIWLSRTVLFDVIPPTSPAPDTP